MNEEITISTENNNSKKTITIFIYALQAASLLLGITFIVAVIINYVKKSDVKGTWLESHFKWQIRTFWFYCLWTIIGVVGVITAPFSIGYFLFAGYIFLFTSYVLLVVNFIWVMYRIIKGWLRLYGGKEMYT